MIIFLYGPDRYRLNMGAEQVVLSYKKKHSSGMNFFSFDLADKMNLPRLEDAVKTASFFEEVKLLLVRNVFINGDVSEAVSRIIGEYGIDKNKEVVILAVEQSAAKEMEKIDKGLFRLLTSSATTLRAFEHLDGPKLLNWIKSEFALRGCSIHTAVAKRIINIIGNNSQGIINEIEKLANYKQKGAVSAADVDKLVFADNELNIFDLVDAVASKNKAKAYEMVYKEISEGRDPHYVLSMMVFGFRNLITVKDLLDRKLGTDSIARQSKLHPFVVKKTSANASKFTIGELKESYKKLLAADVLGKNGAVNITDSIFSFVLGN